jgi:hypothetical protein
LLVHRFKPVQAVLEQLRNAYPTAGRHDREPKARGQSDELIPVAVRITEVQIELFGEEPRNFHVVDEQGQDLDPALGDCFVQRHSNLALHPFRLNRGARDHGTQELTSSNSVLDALEQAVADTNLGFVNPNGGSNIAKVSCETANKCLVLARVTQKDA